MQLKGETVDTYLGYHYYINAIMLKSSHKKPYVAVDLVSLNNTQSLLLVLCTKVMIIQPEKNLSYAHRLIYPKLI